MTAKPNISKAPRKSRQHLSLLATAVILVREGYQVAAEEMDTSLEAALAAIEDISRDEELWYEAPIERGQLQYLNNHAIGHYRSIFTDHDDPEKKRHLYRTWHRNSGRRTYDGR